MDAFVNTREIYEEEATAPTFSIAYRSNLIYCFAGAISSPLRGTQCASNKNHFL